MTRLCGRVFKERKMEKRVSAQLITIILNWNKILHYSFSRAPLWFKFVFNLYSIGLRETIKDVIIILTEKNKYQAKILLYTSLKKEKKSSKIS